ncbi:uncharacterized protein LOC133185821 [Saccostrea echinata]|uniref:uncharacterized protein LOC133185821 n=1 Tax=Saccostrea echinata TaxID=191078 RepID=UPI002A837224|nr:uncharacterized protein LOC133185821 [Saccostrea echinata]
MSGVEFGSSMKKECFHFQEGYTFVNHGSFGAVPLVIQEKQRRLLDESNKNPDIFFRKREKMLYLEARDVASRFLGAKPENLVFVTNTTKGVNCVLRSLPWKKGDGILTTNFTFPANIKACQRLTQYSAGGHFYQFEIRLPIRHEAEVVRNMTSYLDKFSNIRLIDHISSPTALVFPLKEMIAECRKRNVLILVDGAHALGQIAVNLEDLRPDFYIGNFYKWLYSPRGCAVLWVAGEHQTWCTPLATSVMYREGFQLEFMMQGTRDNIPYYLVPAALKFYKDIGGMEKINRYTVNLLEKACLLLEEILGTTGVGIPDSMKAPRIRLVPLPQYEEYQATTDGAKQLNLDIMEKHNVICLVCAVQNQLYLRLSANIYNELSDYERLAEVLCELRRPRITKKAIMLWKSNL